MLASRSRMHERVAIGLTIRIAERPVEGVDVYVTNKEVTARLFAELAELFGARGIFLRKITRGCGRHLHSYSAKYQDFPRRHRYPGRAHSGHQ